jgi:tellurite resistance protein
MPSDDRISLLARVARTRSTATAAEGAPHTSILSLAAASYGARPEEETTVPTGFDPAAVALFEAIVEGAYLVASADGVFDDAERGAFEKVVSVACGGTVGQKQVSDLVSDLADQLGEDGLDARIAAIGRQVGAREEHAREVLRIAALLAHVSDDVSDVERGVLSKLAQAIGLSDADVGAALDDVRRALEESAA